MRNVAIACQGGGSHTAFTAGVLKQLLPYVANREDCQLVGLSGTSGGAVSALAGWYGYLTGGGEGAVETLRDLWGDVAVDGPCGLLLNRWAVFGMRLQYSSVPVPTVSPYHHPFSEMGKREFIRVLERHIDFDRIPELTGPDCPRLVVGTVDINAGEFETFTEENISPKAVLASAAVPTLFEAVEIDGHYHWDGLFSQNPPIYELMHIHPDRKPDELWVVQINPQTRADEPTTIEDISDRRNELSGNISLNQELRFIQRMNDLINSGELATGRYTHTEIRRIELQERLPYSSKLDRSAEFIERLWQRGSDAAQEFLATTDFDDHEHDAGTGGSHT